MNKEFLSYFVRGNLTPPGRLAADETYCGPWNEQGTATGERGRNSSKSGSVTSELGGSVVTLRFPTAGSMDFPGMLFSTGSTISREAKPIGL